MGAIFHVLHDMSNHVGAVQPSMVTPPDYIMATRYATLSTGGGAAAFFTFDHFLNIISLALPAMWTVLYVAQNKL